MAEVLRRASFIFIFLSWQAFHLGGTSSSVHFVSAPGASNLYIQLTLEVDTRANNNGLQRLRHLAEEHGIIQLGFTAALGRTVAANLPVSGSKVWFEANSTLPPSQDNPLLHELNSLTCASLVSSTSISLPSSYGWFPLVRRSHRATITRPDDLFCIENLATLSKLFSGADAAIMAQLQELDLHQQTFSAVELSLQQSQLARHYLARLTVTASLPVSLNTWRWPCCGVKPDRPYPVSWHLPNGDISGPFIDQTMLTNATLPMKPDASLRFHKSTASHPTVFVRRSVGGLGHEHGLIQTSVTNAGTQDLTILIEEAVPWQVLVLQHTRQITQAGTGRIAALRQQSILPSKDRATAALWRGVVDLPRNATIVMRVDFQQQFLPTADYPRDPFKGVSIPHGYITLLDDQLRPLEQYPSPIVSIAMAVPDMSMPYNVIMITGTLLSIAVSTFFSIGSGRLQPMSTSPQRSLFQKLRARLAS